MKKADDKVSLDEEGKEKEKYTNFEMLEAKVEVLKEEVELIGGILRQHDLTFKEETEVNKDLDDETFKRLEAD